MPNFEQTITKWVKRQEIAMNAVAQEAAQELVEEVVKPTAKGGRMRVDTGFLRNSLTAALNSIPSGSGVRPDGYKSTSYDIAPLVLVLNKLKAGDRLVLGFVAKYAKHREYRDFFVRSAAQNWQQHVSKAVKKVDKAIR